jgi:hypothetical protein
VKRVFFARMADIITRCVSDGDRDDRRARVLGACTSPLAEAAP